MTSQPYSPQRRARTDLIGAATTLFGRTDDAQPAGDDEQHAPSWLERIEHWVRSTRLAWWLRRYGGVYRRMAALNDAEVAQTVGIAWLAFACASVVAAVVGGPWSAAATGPLGIAGLAATVVAVIWWFGYRRSGAQLRHQMLAREGFARGREVAEHVRAFIQLVTAETVRPMLTAEVRAAGCAVKPEDVAFLLGHTYGEEVWVGLERPVYVLRPARSGKGVGVVVPAGSCAPCSRLGRRSSTTSSPTSAPTSTGRWTRSSPWPRPRARRSGLGLKIVT